jgi:hypothetical protein
VPYKNTTTPLPEDKRSLRRIKDTMKSVCAPYDQFSNYYKLEEVIDLYLEIWYDEESD